MITIAGVFAFIWKIGKTILKRKEHSIPRDISSNTWVDTTVHAPRTKQVDLLSYGMREEGQSTLEQWGFDDDNS